MKRVKPFFIAILVFSIMSMASSLANAEVYADIYGGVALPLGGDVTVTGSSGGLTAKTTGEVDYKDSFTVGGRVGFWYTETTPSMSYVGAALDVSYFKTEAYDFGTDIYVVPISLLIMLRHPGETFQPYLGLGGGIFVSYVQQDVDLSSIGAGTLTLCDTSVDPGFDARAGLAIKVHESFAVFGEGRYTYFNPKYKDTKMVLGVPVNVEAETHVNVFYFLAGISYRF